MMQETSIHRRRAAHRPRLARARALSSDLLDRLPPVLLLAGALGFSLATLAAAAVLSVV
jgi:hypothetical protein